MSPAKIKVLIVDDSAVVRQTLKQIFEEDRNIEVVGVAADPLIALKRLESDKPDVITLDIEMPRMDGLTFLKKIMSENPIPVIICSSKSEDGSDNALNALEYGAVDIIQKPKMGTKQFLEDSKVRLVDAVKAAAIARIKKGAPKPAVVRREVQPKLSADVVLPRAAGPSHIDTTEKIIVVGASTGGTEALKVFLEEMPIDAPGIVIVQHMPENFTKAFAQRLNSICDLEIKEAADNDSVIRGRALIAPGNKHCLIKRSGARYYVEVKDGPLVCRHRPSVDVLFRSASRFVGKNAVGIIMTGMGDDGARGMKEMKENGAYNIAQDENSCVVFGMPNEAIKRGCVDLIIPLEQIAAAALKAAR
ncbi:protein-glutamate methylesterase/protein-glutamine glutaminase [Spirochaeta isovalerica]|uniref:Protein-glutamate methylesterase/protein-glutamine glutaminase n=1 Tax=Spirochaeta isovalerica TaxID=150 RepID=A0A841R966_9SPIO|nr:chemotaxis response regulator protein-glutamate methylesterase [Spirochaeta isovalerica]MBB6479012.1 two-component system chemotaxis response regulator CheB [Spirochaeta isovalerica]